MPPPFESDSAEVVVVGAGPTGLATAAALSRHGIAAVVLERGDAVGATWRHHYRALRLNSGRTFSTLPGGRFPRRTPTFPTRDDLVRYLEDYQARHRLEVRTGTEVTRIDADGDRWLLDTGHGKVPARQVVVATGLLSRPHLPEALAARDTAVPVIHSADYVDPTPYRGRDVLLVGCGSSAMEIAHDLVAGGANRVMMSVRTPPNILPRAIAGLPGDPAVLLLMRLPPRIADRLLWPVRRMAIGDLKAHGLPAPAEGPFTTLRRSPAGPAVVDREVIDDIRAGRVEIVAALDRMVDEGACLRDGTTVRADAVVAATGFRAGLEPMVGHLGVLDRSGAPTATDDRAALPGLRFVNMRGRPGLLNAAGGRARRTAAAIARDMR